MSLIDFVQGRVVERGADALVLSVGGIGLRLLTSGPTAAAAPAVGEEARLLTYLHIREDALTLYGFASAAERELFTRLLGVGGIGPRSALAALSTLSAERLAAAIAAGDAQALARVPGIGAKSAARIVLELKGKLPALDGLGGESVVGEVAGSLESEVALALRGLGLTPSEVATRLAALPRDPGLSVEEALRLALQQAATP